LDTSAAVQGSASATQVAGLLLKWQISAHVLVARTKNCTPALQIAGALGYN